MAYWLESRTRNPKVASSNLGPAGIVGGGVNVQRSLSTFNTTTEVPLSKAPNSQLLPGRRSINGCPLLRVCVHCCVCVHFGWVNAEHEFRVWVTILGCMSLSLSLIMIATFWSNHTITMSCHYKPDFLSFFWGTQTIF